MESTTTTEDHCHCGKSGERYGSDHCESCGCEQYEAYCDHVHTDDQED